MARNIFLTFVVLTTTAGAACEAKAGDDAVSLRARSGDSCTCNSGLNGGLATVNIMRPEES